MLLQCNIIGGRQYCYCILLYYHCMEACMQYCYCNINITGGRQYCYCNVISLEACSIVTALDIISLKAGSMVTAMQYHWRHVVLLLHIVLSLHGGMQYCYCNVILLEAGNIVTAYCIIMAWGHPYSVITAMYYHWRCACSS